MNAALVGLVLLALATAPGLAEAGASDGGDPNVDPVRACEAAPYPGGADPASWALRLLNDVVTSFCDPNP